ncbi:hypothetical protein C4577_07345 [Candidatus Parcubacteria bacterium]|nr:MAG: hypothetical protein C4577_07345 [Candidatus Parcubacteria bacterium]
MKDLIYVTVMIVLVTGSSFVWYYTGKNEGHSNGYSIGCKDGRRAIQREAIARGFGNYKSYSEDNFGNPTQYFEWKEVKKD